MSPPAQNDRPTAVMTSAPTSGRPSTSSKVAISSSAMPGVSALRRSGALSVTTATPPSTSSRTSPESVTSTHLSKKRKSSDDAGQRRPQPVGTVGEHARGQHPRPGEFAAGLVAPGPQPPGQVVQLVLLGEPDRTVHLVGQPRDHLHRRARPYLSRGGREDDVLAAVERLDGGVDRRGHGGDLAGHLRELHLDRLEP